MPRNESESIDWTALEGSFDDPLTEEEIRQHQEWLASLDAEEFAIIASYEALALADTESEAWEQAAQAIETPTVPNGWDSV